MAKVMVTIRVMPENVEADLDKLEEESKKEITDFGGDVVGTKREPIAFGLNALDIEFFMDEDKGATDPLEEKLASLEGVASASTTMVRRTVG
ncbi:MAG: elongation factor 1-beta [Nanoarchaeota archaeon]|nr:elongation factor 1-beta [Nanoarchaeota archaeon]MCG2719063.1 elongation factor 1-beta [Nanoarchaeota archaeon]